MAVQACAQITHIGALSAVRLLGGSPHSPWIHFLEDLQTRSTLHTPLQQLSAISFCFYFLRHRLGQAEMHGRQSISPTAGVKTPTSPGSPHSHSPYGSWSDEKRSSVRSKKARGSPKKGEKAFFEHLSPREREENWVGIGRQASDMVASSALVSNRLAEVLSISMCMHVFMRACGVQMRCTSFCFCYGEHV